MDCGVRADFESQHYFLSGWFFVCFELGCFMSLSLSLLIFKMVKVIIVSTESYHAFDSVSYAIVCPMQ